MATLSWSAPRGCPDQASVAARLTAREGETARRNLKVRARVQRVGRARYLLKLVLRAADYHAERRLESTSCTSVTDAALWLIAVALDPSLTTRSVAALPTDVDPSPPRPPVEAPSAGGSALPPPSATQVTPTATESPAPTAAPASTVVVSQSARRAPWRVDWARLPRWWRAGLFGGVWSAALPAPQASVGARLGFGISVFYAELRGAAALARAQLVSETTEVRLATQDLGLALCSQWGDRVRVGPCVTASALRTTGSVSGAPEANDQVLPWGAAGVSVELAWRAVGGLEIMLDTGVQLPISARPRYTVDGIGEVAVAAPVSVYARLGLGFRSTDVAREQ